METLKSIYDKVSYILEKHIQLNKQATVALQALNYNGFKRLHRYNAEKMLCWQFKLSNILFNYKREKLDVQSITMTYEPMNLKEHLSNWIDELNYAIKELGNLNKMHMETCGNSSCIIKDIIYLMLDNLGDAQRWYAKGEATEWLEINSFMIDDHIHTKYKKKEKEWLDGKKD